VRRFVVTSKAANQSDAERKKAFLKLLLEILRKRKRRSGK